MSLLVALYLQAAVTTAQSTPAPARDATVSGVVVPSRKGKAKPNIVYTPTYKAAPHLAPGATVIGGSMTIDQMFTSEQGTRYQSARWATQSMAALSLSAIAAQRLRAKKAAELINAGRCPDALQASFNEGDAYLTSRIAQTCALPLPVERPRGY